MIIASSIVDVLFTRNQVRERGVDHHDHRRVVVFVCSKDTSAPIGNMGSAVLARRVAD